VADKIAGFLHFSVPDIGPLADFDQTPGHMISLITDGLTNGLGSVQSAAQKVAQTISNGMSMPLAPMGGAALAGAGGGANYNITVNASGNVTQSNQQLATMISQSIVQQTKLQGKF
jgi:hypothetical protein